MKIISMATSSSTPADFSEEDVERHRRMARMGRNEAPVAACATACS